MPQKQSDCEADIGVYVHVYLDADQLVFTMVESPWEIVVDVITITSPLELVPTQL